MGRVKTTSTSPARRRLQRLAALGVLGVQSLRVIPAGGQQPPAEEALRSATIAPSPSPGSIAAAAETARAESVALAEREHEPKAHFFDHINVRGYTQVRYNQLLASNERLVNLQGDRSVGQKAGLLVRRARLVLSGDIHPYVSMYLQTDFANSVGDSLHLAQVRDWYFDVGLDPDQVFRFRVGQSKVPYGFENPQSSQNRLPMDRSDALNSALSGERDLGIFFYYTPEAIQKTLRHLVSAGLKGSGNYGMLGVGVFQGQTINRADANENKHVIARLAVPFSIGGQYVEAGISGYTGKYVVRTDEGILSAPEGVRDARVAGHFVLYPQPFGLELEYNFGDGPQLAALDAATDAEGDTSYTGIVQRRRLHGGRALASLALGNVIPFVRVHYYKGGKKHERNAPYYDVKELEAGAEWRVIQAIELTGAFTIAKRTDGGRIPYALEGGHMLRLQAQFNY